MTGTQTLYLLPGLLCDASVWASQIKALSDRNIDVRVVDFRGFDSIEGMAQAVLAEAPECFALAGHSMGGRVAMEMVRTAPDRIERLALLDTASHPRRDGEAEKRQILVDLAYSSGMTALAEQWLPPMVHPERIQDAELMGPLRAMVERMSPQIFERQVHALLTRPDAYVTLGAITCPVLLGVGREDSWSPIAQHEAMASVIPQAKLVIFEDSGHMSTVEAPEAVTSALETWLC